MSKKSSLKNKTLTNPVSGKPMTALMLLQALHSILKDPTLGPAALAKPIQMYSDEEGNGLYQLWQVDIDKTGQVSLLPAGDNLID
jgi:hypothetical protein